MERNKLSTSMNDVELLENESSFPKNCSVPARQAINEISVFLNYLNSTGRIAISNASEQEMQELIGLLTTLKETARSAFQEIGRNAHKKAFTYTCSICNETITLSADQDVWENLQDHEHFEETYLQALNGTLEITPLEGFDYSENYEDYDGIDLYEDFNENSSGSYEEPPLGDNSFRFNFSVEYDPQVRNALYPKSFGSLQIPVNNCLQKISATTCICLLCVRHLSGKKDMPGQHVNGAKHELAALDSVRLMNLNNFHLAFLNLEVNLQAHQVYFQPAQHSNDSVNCRACKTDVKICKVADHILGKRHRDIFLNNFRNKPASLFLMNLQSLCYGIGNGTANGNETQDASESSEAHDVRPSYDLRNPESWNFLLPLRYLSQADHFQRNKTSVICKLCNKMVQLDPNKMIQLSQKLLLHHIESKTHMKLAKISQTNYNYFCQICNKILKKNDWNRHFKAIKEHMKVWKGLHKLGEHQCLTCNLIIFGDKLSVKNHPINIKSSSNEIKYQLSDFTRTTFSSVEQLNRIANSMALEADIVANCTSTTETFCKRLEYILKARLAEVSRCRAYPFGSRVCGLGNRESDLDVFVDLGDMYTGDMNQDYDSQCRIVKKVSKVLRQHRDEFESIYAIPDARTPIVGFTCRKNRIKCDLSFRHGLSVENTEFVGLCLELQPITQKLILVLKKWFETNQLKKRIPTYAVTMMAIFYMQVNNYLLSVSKLRELNPGPATLIDGWEAINYTMSTEEMKTHIIPYQHTLDKLLKDFFVYYLNFNYKEDVVCPLLGHTIKIELFEKPELLPSEMRRYVEQLDDEETYEIFQLSSFCIQDPFDLSHNLAKAWKDNSVQAFTSFCAMTIELL